MYCKENTTMARIAEQIGVSKPMVFYALKTYRETASKQNTVRSTQPRKTTVQVDRAIIRASKRSPFMTSTETLADNRPILLSSICARTVRSRLHEAGLRGCIARRKPLVSANNIKKRMQFARIHMGNPMWWCGVHFLGIALGLFVVLLDGLPTRVHKYFGERHAALLCRENAHALHISTRQWP